MRLKLAKNRPVELVLMKGCAFSFELSSPVAHSSNYVLTIFHRCLYLSRDGDS
jgi:hypothetical protein